jgi:hypothetical protein
MAPISVNGVMTTGWPEFCHGQQAVGHRLVKRRGCSRK